MNVSKIKRLLRKHEISHGGMTPKMLVNCGAVDLGMRAWLESDEERPQGLYSYLSKCLPDDDAAIAPGLLLGRFSLNAYNTCS